MSRTYRRRRKSSGTVPDGRMQYASSSCQHNNACSYCRENRTHGKRRREPITHREDFNYHG